MACVLSPLPVPFQCHHPLSPGKRAQVSYLIEFIDNLAANQFLQHILKRDNTGKSTKLINDRQHMLAPVKKGGEHFVERRRRDNEMDWSHE